MTLYAKVCYISSKNKINTDFHALLLPTFQEKVTFAKKVKTTGNIRETFLIKSDKIPNLQIYGSYKKTGKNVKNNEHFANITDTCTCSESFQTLFCIFKEAIIRIDFDVFLRISNKKIYGSLLHGYRWRDSKC